MDDKKIILDLITKYPHGYSSILRHKYPELLKKIYLLQYPTLGEKIYIFINGEIEHICKTPMCEKLTKFKQFSHGYYEFCSSSCRAKFNKSNLNGLTKNALDKKRNTLKNNLNDPIFKENRKKKMEETSLKNYGVTHWSKTEQFRNIQGKIYDENRPQELNDYVWLYDQYITKNKTITKIADELNTSWDIVNNSLNRNKIVERHYDYTSSLAEEQIINFLTSLSISAYKNNRKIIEPKEIDIFIPNYNIAIEYCGLYWHSESSNKRNNKDYHNNKRIKCKQKNIMLLTIFEDEWNKKQEIVKSRIKHSLKLNTANKIYARKCTVKKITNKEAKLFFDANHIQGHRGANVYIGLFDNNVMVSSMSFAKSRYDKNSQWEMIRFSSLLNYNIVGAGSKLFSFFIKYYSPETIISYSDNRWGDGSFYKKLGFKFIKETSPSYFYFKRNELIRYHRSAFMKHKILKLGGDSNLTEYENMKKMGYHRIYDCGTTKWFWSK